MAKKEEIDIYDLDETLLRGNSTRLYLDTPTLAGDRVVAHGHGCRAAPLAYRKP